MHDITEGDELDTPAGTFEIKSVDGHTVTLSNGLEKSLDTVKDDIQFGEVEHIPSWVGERGTYIRFGEIPDGEESKNHGTNQSESGVSVYDINETDGGYLPTGNKIQQVFLLAAKDAYLVEGVKVAEGSDGEPVIKDVSVESELERTERGVLVEA